MTKAKQHTIVHCDKKITGSGNVYTFAYLHRGSRHFMEMAELTEEGRIYNLISAMIYCAFTLEALIHHIGEMKMGMIWSCHERKSPKEKLRVLKKEYRWDIDLGKRPFQTFHSIFSYRDDIVHGKTEIDIPPTVKPEKKFPVDFESEWMKYTNLETAKIFIEDTDQMVKQLITLTDHPKLFYGQMGFAEYSTTLIKNVEDKTL